MNKDNKEIDIRKIEYRWVDGPTATAEDWDRVESILAARGWMSLNRATSRILIAEAPGPDGRLLAFVVFQLIPHLEPLWIAPSVRGTGLAEELSDRIIRFMVENGARGWISVADSPFAEKLCEREGMVRVSSPVYIAK